MTLVDPTMAVERARLLHAHAERARDEARRFRSQSQQARIMRAMGSAGQSTVAFPVAYVSTGTEGLTATHAVDGDGSSLCNLFQPADLTVVAGMTWDDLPAVAACPYCTVVMTRPFRPDPSL